MGQVLSKEKGKEGGGLTIKCLYFLVFMFSYMVDGCFALKFLNGFVGGKGL